MRENGPPLLIISQDQFGYLTDTFKYCRYLQTDFRITYVGWEYGLPAIALGRMSRACTFRVPAAKCGGTWSSSRERWRSSARQPADGSDLRRVLPARARCWRSSADHGDGW